MSTIRHVKTGGRARPDHDTVIRDANNGEYFLKSWRSQKGSASPAIRRLGVECIKTDSGWEVTVHNKNKVDTYHGSKGYLQESDYYEPIDRLYERGLSGKRTLIYSRNGIS